MLPIINYLRHYKFETMKGIFLAFSLAIFFAVGCGNNEQVISADQIVAEANSGTGYELLRELTKEIGPRLSGSENAAKAVQWGIETFEKLGFDTFYLQEVMVPHWERGEAEEAFMLNTGASIEVTALGGSVGTDGLLEAEVIQVKSFKELEDLGRKNIEGKVVFYNRPMDGKLRNTFRAYGMAVNQRADGAWQAAQYGAKAVLVRSMTTAKDLNPHTGTMNYVDSIAKIPAFAIATADAEKLAAAMEKETQKVSLKSNCQWFPDALSHNVIGEIWGSSDSIIAIGGHLDSWDLGEGAHDDGAGIVHSIEAVRILKALGYKPKNTLRVVMFMNEENGAMGGKMYAEQADRLGEKHLAAIESDRGGFEAEAFSVDGDSSQIDLIKSLLPQLSKTDIKEVYQGYAGVDISFLREYNPNLCMIGLVPNPEKYFNYHHTKADVLESVDPKELASGSAALANLIYLIDSRGKL